MTCNQRKIIIRTHSLYASVIIKHGEEQGGAMMTHEDQSYLLPKRLRLLTAACARSRSHRRSQTSDSRNIRCTCWPETRRCRRRGEVRWSALSPPWQSLLPALSASGAVRTPDKEREGERNHPGRREGGRREGSLLLQAGDVSPSCSLDARLTYAGASWRCGRVVVFSPPLSPPLFSLSAHAVEE